MQRDDLERAIAAPVPPPTKQALRDDVMGVGFLVGGAIDESDSRRPGRSWAAVGNEPPADSGVGNQRSRTSTLGEAPAGFGAADNTPWRSVCHRTDLTASRAQAALFTSP